MITPGQFDVSSTGAFTYKIPIAVPPGTGGMAPSLSLEYSSRGGDGQVGLGWVLAGLPSITLCPRTYAQDGEHRGVDFNQYDRFCLDGLRLMKSAGTGQYGDDLVEYRTEVDSYTKVISHTSGSNHNPDWFEVHTKSGQIMEFGHSLDSRIKPALPDGSGGTLSFVRAWAVNKISDTVGNYLVVTYTNDTVNGQVYPTEIDYTANDRQGLPAYNSVRFGYLFKNDGAIVAAYHAGSIMRTTVLLNEIKTCIGISPATCTINSGQISDYQLTYNRATTGIQHDEVASVQLWDGVGNNLAKTSFAWLGQPNVLTVNPVADTTGHNGTQTKPNNRGADFNGDGLVDAAVLMAQTHPCDGTPSIYYGSQNGTFSVSGMTMNFLAGYGNGIDCTGTGNVAEFHNGYTNLIDYDGDGLVDVAENDSGSTTHKYLFRDAMGYFQQTAYLDHAKYFDDYNADSRTDYLMVPSSGPAVPYYSRGDGTFDVGLGLTGIGDSTTIVTGDFDGDGCADILAQGTDNGMHNICNVGAPAFANPPNWVNSKYGLVLGDFNGDGLTDVMRIGPATSSGTSPDNTRIYLSQGTSFVLQNWVGPRIDPDYQQVVTGDWNGDGKTDFAIIQECQTYNPQFDICNGGQLSFQPGPHHVYFSYGNDAGAVDFVDMADIDNSNPADGNGGPKMSAVAADWNNDGVMDIWLQKPSGDTKYLFTNTPLPQPFAPELIKSVDNGIGIVTTVSYDRLNTNGTFYVKSSDPSGCTGTPPIPCTRNVEGPLYVVSQVTSSDGVGGTYTSTYAYAGAKTDLMGRGFLGFAKVTITDPLGVAQTTNYHTDFPYIGLVASQTKTQGALTLNSLVNTFDNVSHGSAGIWYTVRLRTAVALSNDTDGTAMPTVETDYDNYDSFGDSKLVTVKTTPPGGSTPDLTKVTTNTFTNDTVNWILGRLTKATVVSTYSSSTITRVSGFSYYANGLLSEEVVEPGASNTSNLKVTTDYVYDGFGSKTSATVTGSGNPAPPSCLTTTGYDTKGQFPVTVTNCASVPQSETWGTSSQPGYDLRFGEPTKHTGPNNLTTMWTYDTFGRRTQETRPDGTITKTTYAYCNGVNGGTDTTCPSHGAYLSTTTTLGSDGTTQIAPTMRSYFDGLSRQIAGDLQGFDGSWIRNDTIYDTYGRVLKTSRPYFLQNPSPVYVTFAYDYLGRVTQATNPDNGYTHTDYHGLTVVSTLHLIRPDQTTRDQITTTVKNDLGQIASVTDPLALGQPDPSYLHTTRYTYDAVGNLLTTVDPMGNTIVNQYDTRGRKTQSTDPDMGLWTYVYDSLGRLVQQVDPKERANSTSTTIGYDTLGRVTTRTEPDMSSTWTYDTATNGIDKLAQAACSGTACASGGYTRSYLYDTTGRQSQVTIVTNAGSYFAQPTYDPISGKVVTARAFSGYTTKNIYNATGYLSQVQDNQTAFTLWTANSRDAELHLLSATAGNGVTTAQSFDANSGVVRTITAGANQAVANLGFDWDTAGNLANRTDTHMTGWQQESFCYDLLNRLVNSNFGTTCTGNTAVTYDSIGDILTKTGTGTYSYPASGPSSVRPHAVSSITGTVNGVVNPTYGYDANGNMTSGAARTITSTSFNMAAAVTDGAASLSLTYDPEHGRIQQTVGAVTTTYLNDSVTGSMTERVGGATITWRTYIMADGKLVAERFVTGPTVTMRYFVLDNLGSVAVITDEAGNVLTDGMGHETGRLSYDSWGSMRNLNGTADTSCVLPAQSATTRGFTGQEQMPAVCLINFNARIYDPAIGRFMSPDAVVATYYNVQNLNRFTYVGNNPLSFTDPSGNMTVAQIIGAVVAVAIIIAAPYIGYPTAGAYLSALSVFEAEAIAISVASSIVAGAFSAGISGGDVGKGALFGGVSGLLFAGVPALGNALNIALHTTTEPIVGRLIASGFAGGLKSTIEGAHFGSGFVSAGVGALAGGLGGGQFDPSRLILASAIGGFASVLGGGKFANGAITSAFAYVMTAKYDSGQSTTAPNSANQFAGPGASVGRRWNTWDFVNHYYTGNGGKIDLRAVGLADQFESALSVETQVDKFILNTVFYGGDGYTAKEEFFTNMIADYGFSPVSNPLYSLGLGVVFATAACGPSSCSFNFEYVDKFEEPLDIPGLELPGGTPYKIIDTWTALRPLAPGPK